MGQIKGQLGQILHDLFCSKNDKIGIFLKKGHFCKMGQIQPILNSSHIQIKLLFHKNYIWFILKIT